MNITELAQYIKDPAINGRLARSLVETLDDTVADAGLVGFDYMDPALVLLPLSKISPSVLIRRQLHAALDLRGTSLEGETQQLIERLKSWRMNNETIETIRHSHDATKEMFRVMFATAQSRSTRDGASVSRGDLVIGVFKSGSPILDSFGENFTDYALKVFTKRPEPSFA